VPEAVSEFNRAVLVMHFHGLPRRCGIDRDHPPFRNEIHEEAASSEVALDKDVVVWAGDALKPFANGFQKGPDLPQVGWDLTP
jgi:hypothetical protein